MTTTARIETLAADMGVSVSDLRMLAQSAANGIEQDKADQAFIAADSETRTEIALAYAEHACKKFQSFVTTYLSATGARQAFVDAVITAE